MLPATGSGFTSAPHPIRELSFREKLNNGRLCEED
jgi:hypothetical protein